jgi:hypothetical protein
MSDMITISRDDIQKMIQVEIENRFSKLCWNAHLNLYKALVPISLIYGGATRDYITRTLAAKEYYEYCNINQIDAVSNYCNLEVHPESFKDRNKFPKDIDIFIKESVYNEFIKNNGTKFNLIEKKCHKDNTNYFFQSNSLFKEAIFHKKYITNFMKFYTVCGIDIIMGDNFKKNSIIKIDFIIIRDEYTDYLEYKHRGTLYPPFGNPDFDVNELCFTYDYDDGFYCKPLPYITKRIYNQLGIKYEYGFRPLDTTQYNYDILQNIIKNIKSKKAIPIFPDDDEYKNIFGKAKIFAIDFHRIRKIIALGFSLQKWDVIIPIISKIIWAPKDYVYQDDEKCLICYDIFDIEKKWFNCCGTCNGKIHQNCFTKFLQESLNSSNGQVIRCPQCRGDISYISKCNTQYLTYFNAIDLIINNDTKCYLCNKRFDYYCTPACKCWEIKFPSNSNSADPDLVD